jgi:hypothetical protein
MDESDQMVGNESSQSPTASLARNDQMPSRRDFEIVKSKHLALQANTVIQFTNCDTFAN